MDEQAGKDDDYGVLVGWTHRTSADQIDLKLQTVQSTRQLKGDAVDSHHIIMTKSQAQLLANYLFEVSGKSRPSPRRGLLARWFGG